MTKNTPVNSRVVHSDCDEFPPLFYQDTHNTYIAGLDPTFLYKANAETYWTWANLTLGKFSGNVYDAVTKTLQSQYVLVSTGHETMRSLILKDGHFHEIYRDAEANIYVASATTTTE